MIQYTITFNGPQEYIDLMAQETSYAPFKYVVNENKERMPETEIVDSEEFIKLDENGDIIWKTIPVTVDEHISSLIKEAVMLRIVHKTTSNLQNKLGTANYNAEEMNALVDSLLTVTKI